ncbi:MAG: hypothetical protein WC003_11485 [Terrimicrobiaceae bacterium]
MNKITLQQISGTPSDGRPKLAELPITFRLPKSGQRDAHFGLSRSWYYAAEADGRLALIRLRDKGKKRGTTLVPTAAVLVMLGGDGE